MRGVGIGDAAPAGAELTHAFVRTRLQKYVLERIRSDPIKAFDNGDWLARMEAFERAFFDSGSNAAFGELGCVIAQDALRADGALATARHPFRNHHYKLSSRTDGSRRLVPCGDLVRILSASGTEAPLDLRSALLRPLTTSQTAVGSWLSSCRLVNFTSAMTLSAAGASTFWCRTLFPHPRVHC